MCRCVVIFSVFYSVCSGFDWQTEIQIMWLRIVGFLQSFQVHAGWVHLRKAQLFSDTSLLITTHNLLPPRRCTTLRIKESIANFTLNYVLSLSVLWGISYRIWYRISLCLEYLCCSYLRLFMNVPSKAYIFRIGFQVCRPLYTILPIISL